MQESYLKITIEEILGQEGIDIVLSDDQLNTIALDFAGALSVAHQASGVEAIEKAPKISEEQHQILGYREAIRAAYELLNVSIHASFRPPYRPEISRNVTYSIGNSHQTTEQEIIS